MEKYMLQLVRITSLCLIIDYASCTAIIDGPNNVTVLSGSDASFQCTVGSGWQSLSWSLQNVFIVTVTPTKTTVSNNYNIIVQNRTDSNTGAFTSEITIVNVTRTNSGAVRCGSLSAPFQDAYLTVQVSGSILITNGSVVVASDSPVIMECRAVQWFPVPTISWQIDDSPVDPSYYSTTYTPEDEQLLTAQSTFTFSPNKDLSLTCLASIETLSRPQAATVTVQVTSPGSSLSQTDIILIAVFTSLGGLLLIIIIVIIVCCYKRKKKRESSYRNDAWKDQEKRETNPRIIERDSLGEQNYAYTSDPVPVQHKQTPDVSPPGSIYENNSAFRDNTSASSASSVQVPAQKCVDNHLKTIRRATHV